ncbi:GNAT family N-acetyltransferase [Lysinibacillus sp. JNUCC-52]|uniref:GNAT family N-acetyltransferase n=1 Tax=Lysinibacillus sp. JNUCC-52 TaxID=2792480 RepID=UPI001937C8C4|nr:GNAT family N-acetyltransferase [Lysinibacillus sp. JNUCC-52]
MIIKHVYDYNLDQSTYEQLHKLLIESFEIYPENRIYFKQIPHFRFIICNDNEKVLAQVGLDYRAMKLGDEVINVLGIIDLCVNKIYRNKGLGTKLVRKVLKFAETNSVDFVLLGTEIEEWYEKIGFIKVSNTFTWHAIHDRKLKSLGTRTRDIDRIMVKQTGKKKWNQDSVDFLGYLY